MRIIGHGLRDRQVRGPTAASEASSTRTILIRRYRCCVCDAIMMVVPRGIVARRHYGASAIGLALLLLGVNGLDERAVRGRVCTERVTYDDCRRWPALRRWIAAIDDRRLFVCVRGSPLEATRSQRAARAAMTLVAHAPSSLRESSLEEQVIAGAALAA